MDRPDRRARTGSPRRSDLQIVDWLHLSVKKERLGALDLYAATPWAFDEESEEIGILLALHSAVALANELTADKAFLLLARLSQQHNVGLYKIAEEIAATADISRRVLDDLR